MTDDVSSLVWHSLGALRGKYLGLEWAGACKWHLALGPERGVRLVAESGGLRIAIDGAVRKVRSYYYQKPLKRAPHEAARVARRRRAPW